MTTNHRVYIRVLNERLIGFIKTGEKKLFHRDISGKITEIKLLCVLDFFVHESVRREGHGKALYDHMLINEQQIPENIGIDRPSPKFLGFMKKYFGLAHFIPQADNYVVFTKFFEKNKKPPKAKVLDVTVKGISDYEGPYSNHNINKGFSNAARNILNTRENFNLQNNISDRSQSQGIKYRNNMTGERLGFGRSSQVVKENHLRLRSVKKKENEFDYGIFGYRKGEQTRRRSRIGDFTMNKVYGCFYK